MKAIHHTLFLLLGLLPLLTACSPDPIDIDLPAHQPKLVITSQVLPDNYLLVSVSKSFSSLAGNNGSVQQDSTFLQKIAVERALVVVSYDGLHDTLQHIGNGVYGSEKLIQRPHSMYQLYVKDSVSNLECRSSSVMLPKVPFDTLYPVITRTALDTTVTMEYSFTDPEASGNYYAVSLHPKPKESHYEVNNLVSFTNLNSNTTLLSDKQFTGHHYKGRWKLNVSAQDTIVFSISNISEEYYKFLVAYQRSGKLFNQATGEPINYPSNVSNGYGFFNTHNPDFQAFYLAEW